MLFTNNKSIGLKSMGKRFLGLMPASMNYGWKYQATRRFLRESEKWNREQLNAYQLYKLKELILHASKTVPYYRDNMYKWGIKPEEIKDFSFIKRIPILDKETIAKNSRAFISEKYSEKKRFEVTTSGTTGLTLHFYKLYSDRYLEWAFISNLWKRVGFTNNDWRVVLRGFVPRNISKNIYWEKNYRTHELILSSYHLNSEIMYEYYQLLCKGNYKFLHCHPSSAYTFASYLKSNKLQCSFKAILASSETLYPFQRQLLESVFSCRVFSFYGLSEQVCLAGECEDSHLYHLQPEYGFTELVDSDGRDITDQNKSGEIISTGFINTVTPFIRYRTGDFARISYTKCSCGRNHQLLQQIEGRCSDYIIAQDGRKISLTGLMSIHRFPNVSHVKTIQIQQDRIGEIEIRIVRFPQYSERDELEINRSIVETTSGDINVRFNYVDTIPLGNRGKHQLLVQSLNL